MEVVFHIQTKEVAFHFQKIEVAFHSQRVEVVEIELEAWTELGNIIGNIMQFPSLPSFIWHYSQCQNIFLFTLM
jgi:hypothetical protein